jgi:hypothetical protein
MTNRIAALLREDCATIEELASTIGRGEPEIRTMLLAMEDKGEVTSTWVRPGDDGPRHRAYRMITAE